MYGQLKKKFIDYVAANMEPNIWMKTMEYCKNNLALLRKHIINIRTSDPRGN